MRDVAVLLHAGSKKGLLELATDLRRIPPELSVRADLSEAWSQIGEIDERLLDNFEAAEKSYRNALSSDSSNLRAKAGLERMSRRERLSRQFQGEHERLRAGGL